MSVKGKPIETGSRLVVTGTGGRGKWELTANGYRGSLLGNEILELESSGSFATFVNILKTT